GDPPPVLGKGARLAVLSGDPGAAGPYTIRLKMPTGYKISPHWHPTDENVTVIAGTFSLGQGEKFDRASMKTLTAGGYALLPAEIRMAGEGQESQSFPQEHTQGKAQRLDDRVHQGARRPVPLLPRRTGGAAPDHLRFRVRSEAYEEYRPADDEDGEHYQPRSK